MIKGLRKVEYTLPNEILTVSIEKSDINTNESTLTFKYQSDFENGKVETEDYYTNIVENEIDFNQIVKSRLENFQEESSYIFYDGMVDSHFYFDSLKELIESCKDDMFKWIEDRQNNLDLDCQSSVQGMVDTLSEYAKFLGDMKHLEDKQRIARAIEGMYGWLNDSADWKVYQGSKDLTESESL